MEKEKNNKALIIGIDDAGRGPVLGPMCLAGVLIPKEIEEEFRRSGIKDSKLLTPKKREELAEVIKQTAIKFDFKLLSPADIDTGMGLGVNLNEVEAIAAASIVNNLAKNISSEQKKELVIIIDCPSNNPNSWLNVLFKYLEDKSLRIRAEHKADFHYPSVSAASIIAKTTRDFEIEKLKKEIGFDFGSGYPADPFTKEALENIEKRDALKKHRIIRESWATFQNLETEQQNKKAGKQKGLEDF